MGTNSELIGSGVGIHTTGANPVASPRRVAPLGYHYSLAGARCLKHYGIIQFVGLAYHLEPLHATRAAPGLMHGK